MSWERSEPGLFFYRSERFTGLVQQRVELWEVRVYFDGRLIEMGVWDSREVAFRTANAAIKKFRRYLDIGKFAPDPLTGDDDDED